MKSLRALLLPIIAAAGIVAPTSPASALGGFAHWQNADDMDSGFGFGLRHQFKIVPVVSAEARAAWVRFDGKSGHPKMNMYPLEAIGRVKLGLLYGGGGVGYYLFSGDDFQPKSSVGGTILAGAEFTMLGLGAFAEARYLFLEADEKDEAGGGKRKMSGLGASLGVVIPIG